MGQGIEVYDELGAVWLSSQDMTTRVVGLFEVNVPPEDYTTTNTLVAPYMWQFDYPCPEYTTPWAFASGSDKIYCYALAERVSSTTARLTYRLDNSYWVEGASAYFYYGFC